MHRRQTHQISFWAGRGWRYGGVKQQGLGFCCWKPLTQLQETNPPCIILLESSSRLGPCILLLAALIGRLYWWTWLWGNFTPQSPYHIQKIIKIIISGSDQTALRAWCSAENLSQTTQHYSRAALCCVSHLKEALKEDDAPVMKKKKNNVTHGAVRVQWSVTMHASRHDIRAVRVVRAAAIWAHLKEESRFSLRSWCARKTHAHYLCAATLTKEKKTNSISLVFAYAHVRCMTFTMKHQKKRTTIRPYAI